MTNFDFVIVESLGVIAAYPTGWSKELNRVSWMGSEPKYDLRDWSPDHEHMSKGITMTEDEVQTLREILNGLNGGDDYTITGTASNGDKVVVAECHHDSIVD